MENVTLNELKSFLRVEFNDDDDLITTLGNGAESYIANHLGISGSFSSSLDDNGIAAAKIATYQLCSHFYENRNMSFNGGSMDDVGLKIINPLRDQL
jgi:uncharacterized phage protein (predicted DNA packaging)